jgi:hypothetical protein
MKIFHNDLCFSSFMATIVSTANLKISHKRVKGDLFKGQIYYYNDIIG